MNWRDDEASDEEWVWEDRNSFALEFLTIREVTENWQLSYSRQRAQGISVLGISQCWTKHKTVLHVDPMLDKAGR